MKLPAEIAQELNKSLIGRLLHVGVAESVETNLEAGHTARQLVEPSLGAKIFPNSWMALKRAIREPRTRIHVSRDCSLVMACLALFLIKPSSIYNLA